ATLWVRRRGRPMTGALWLGLAVIGLPSLAWSIYQTAYEPARAFFITTTRMWELAIGAALAIAASQLARMPRVVAVVLGWAGLAAIAAAGLVYSVHTPWPGYAALLPVLGSAAVIAAGTAAGRAGPIALLGTRPFLWVGALSYSLYLWHWPLIVIATYHWGELSLLRGLLVAAISVIPAYVTYRLIENPFRYSAALSRSPRLALSIGANATLIGVLAGTMVVLAVPSAAAPAGPSPGAAVLESRSGATRGAPVDKVEWITPDPLQATKDVPELYADGCQVSAASSDPKACVYGNPDGKTTVALVGDSKIAQWLPAFQLLAKANDWKIITHTKSACPFSSALITLNGEEYQSCTAWNARVLAALTGPDKPDYVITSQVRKFAVRPAGLSGRAAAVDAMVAGMHASWTALIDAGVKVIVLGDTPQTGMSVYECVSENTDHLTRCTYDRAKGVARSALPTQQAAVASMPEVKLVDLTRSICPTPQCAPVIGNVLVYRQGSHLTATYIKTLAPQLGKELTTAELPADGKS
ncbi:MAG: acyltransferase family protein, partial [Actinomycetes bacterium]